MRPKLRRKPLDLHVRFAEPMGNAASKKIRQFKSPLHNLKDDCKSTSITKPHMTNQSTGLEYTNEHESGEGPRNENTTDAEDPISNENYTTDGEGNINNDNYASDGDATTNNDNDTTDATGAENYATDATNDDNYATDATNNDNYAEDDIKNDDYETDVTNKDNYTTDATINDNYNTDPECNDNSPSDADNNDKYTTDPENNGKYTTDAENNEDASDAVQYTPEVTDCDHDETDEIKNSKDKYSKDSIDNDKYMTDTLNCGYKTDLNHGRKTEPRQRQRPDTVYDNFTTDESVYQLCMPKSPRKTTELIPTKSSIKKPGRKTFKTVRYQSEKMKSLVPVMLAIKECERNINELLSTDFVKLRTGHRLYSDSSSYSTSAIQVCARSSIPQCLKYKKFRPTSKNKRERRDERESTDDSCPKKGSSKNGKKTQNWCKFLAPEAGTDSASVVESDSNCVCPCHFPPAYKHFKCVGKLSGQCECGGL